MSDGDATPTTHRRALVAALVGVLVAVLFALVATSGELQLVDQWPPDTRSSTETRTVSTIVPEQVEPPAATPGRIEVPWIIRAVLTALLWAGVAVLAVLVVLSAWRNRPKFRLPRFRRRPSDDFEVLDELTAVMAADAAEQRAALVRGSPRNAIVECWMRLEGAVVDAGMERRASDTSAELTVRVLARRDVDSSAISTLASLYREARFSEHVMTEASRREAIDALDRVHAGLGRPIPSSSSVS